MGFRVVRQLLRFLRPYPWALPALVGLGVLASFSEGVGIGLLIPFLSILLDSGPGDESSPIVALTMRYAGDLSGSDSLLIIGSVIVALVVIKTLIKLSYIWLSADVNERVNHHLRMSLCRQLFEVGYAYIARIDQGQLFNTVQGETYRVSQALTALSLLIGALCTATVFMVLLLLISWQMTSAVVIGALLASLIVRLITRRGQQLGIEAVQAWDGLAERVMEMLNGMRMIRIFAQERRELERFEQASDQTRLVGRRADILVYMISPLMEVIYLPPLFGVLAIGIVTGVAAPTMIAFLILVYRTLPQIKNVDAGRVQLVRFGGTVDAVDRMLRRDDKPYLRSGNRRFDGLRSGITFERVSFAYTRGDERAALHEVDLHLAKGETVAVVGPSGAGKSTLVNLLCRLYDPAVGRILIDGVALTEFEPTSWRRRIALAGQGAELMSGTIRDNIAFGRFDATDAEIVAAARQARAHEFIEALPAGYATAVGPRGTRLSGGQAQRIGLARALLRAPDLLILDEATNALDNPTELAIQQTLEALSGQVTMVVVAHRFSTLRNADRVIVLADGRVVEEGRPSELMRARGAFADLAAGQALALDRTTMAEP